MKRNIWLMGLLAGLAVAGCGGSDAPTRKDAGTDAKKDTGALLDTAGLPTDTKAGDATTTKQDTAVTTGDTLPADTGIAADTTLADAGAPDAAVADAQAVDTALPPLDGAPDVPQQSDTSVSPQLDTQAGDADDGDAGDTKPATVDTRDAIPDSTPTVDTIVDTLGDTFPLGDGVHLVFTDNFQDGDWNDNWLSRSNTGINPEGAWDVASVGGSLALFQNQSIGQTRRFMYMIMPGTDAGATSLGDTTVQARVRITDTANYTAVDFGAKVCARYQIGSSTNVDNVYCVAIFPGATADSGTLRILQGQTPIISTAATVNVVLDTWYTVKLVVSGTSTTTISAYLDGTLVSTATDITTPFQTGAVAVGTTGVMAAFDDIVVTTP